MTNISPNAARMISFWLESQDSSHPQSIEQFRLQTEEIRQEFDAVLPSSENHPNPLLAIAKKLDDMIRLKDRLLNRTRIVCIQQAVYIRKCCARIFVGSFFIAIVDISLKIGSVKAASLSPAIWITACVVSFIFWSVLGVLIPYLAKQVQKFLEKIEQEWEKQYFNEIKIIKKRQDSCHLVLEIFQCLQAVLIEMPRQGIQDPMQTPLGKLMDKMPSRDLDHVFNEDMKVIKQNYPLVHHIMTSKKIKHSLSLL